MADVDFIILSEYFLDGIGDSWIPKLKKTQKNYAKAS
jgi:hypothetical protein